MEAARMAGQVRYIVIALLTFHLVASGVWAGSSAAQTADDRPPPIDSIAITSSPVQGLDGGEPALLQDPAGRARAAVQDAVDSAHVVVQDAADSAQAPGAEPATVRAGPSTLPGAGDEDGDGVLDVLDLCPATPAGARVDQDGCPIPLWRWREVQAVGGVLVVIGAIAALVSRRRSARQTIPDDEDDLEEDELPPLVFPGSSRGAAHVLAEAAGPVMPEAERQMQVQPLVDVAPAGWPAAPTSEPAGAGASPDPDARASTPGVVPLDATDAELVDGETVRFYRPMEGTLQILPGRLEVVEGVDEGKQILFVRVPGTEPEITFGRKPGEPHRHVQLRRPTVSRRHARMRFTEGRWTIVNESVTNPVRVNDKELPADGPGRLLQDGDRIEMGEVVFIFRER